MAKPTEKLYDASPQRLYDAVIRTIAGLGYSVQHTDTQTRTASFNTGMSMRSWAGQNMSVTVSAEGEGARLTIGGTRAQRGNPFGGGGGQIYDWGEAGKVSRKFLERLDVVLPQTPEPEAPKQTSESFATEIERISALHAQGALTDDEFAAAKKRLLG